MQNTTNYGLKKPDGTDQVKISDINGNFDILDAKVKAVENKANTIPASNGAVQTNLNVDMVDGKHASDFMNITKVTAAVDVNTLTSTGTYYIKVSGCTNLPTGSWGILMVSYEGALFQIYIVDTVNTVYKRIRNGTTWGSWIKIADDLSNYAISSHTHDKLVGSNSNGVRVDNVNDYAGLDKTNNVDIKSWFGVSFSNACTNAGIQGKPSVSIDARTGNIYTAGDVIVNGQSLFQSASNGKNSIVNAITGAGGSANTGMTFDQLASSIGNLGGMKYSSGTAWAQVESSGWYSTTVTVPFEIKGIYFESWTTRSGNTNKKYDLYYLPIPACDPLIIKPDELGVSKQSSGNWIFGGNIVSVSDNYGIVTTVNNNNIYLRGHYYTRTTGYSLGIKWFAMGW